MMCRTIFIVCIAMTPFLPAQPAPMVPARFDLLDARDGKCAAPALEPWKCVTLEPDYSGSWVVAGDLDGDGVPEIVSAENVNVTDDHYTSAVSAQRLDGTVLWTWGDPGIGRKNLHHDVACQIYDWDGDGRNDVVVAAKEAVVAMDGVSGAEKARFPIPENASDCIVCCNLTGGPRAENILVKSRYKQIWAYTRAGELLWTRETPGGYKTSHQPYPVDLDSDGRDEIVAGYALLNADGTVRWTVSSEKVDLRKGHLDCARVMTKGASPAATRIAMSYCGALDLAVVTGEGKTVWEIPGSHFESIQMGRVFPDVPGPQLLVDIDHTDRGYGPVCVFDGEGMLLARIMTDYGRQHRLLDWTGDGLDDIVVCGSMGLYDYTGACIGRFTLPVDPETGKEESASSVLLADMTGDGVPDLMFVTSKQVYIFRNEKGGRPATPFPLGTGGNVTFY